jgi:hypothetical protein
VFEHAAVTLRIRTLGHDGQIEPFRVQISQRTKEPVDISADASSVCGDAGCVDEHSRGATGGHEATPKEVVIQTTGKTTPGMHPACHRDTAELSAFPGSADDIHRTFSNSYTE